MAILIEEDWGREDKADVKGQQERTRHFKVYCERSDLPITANDIYAAPGCPHRYDDYPFATGIKCVDLSITEISETLSKLSAHYSTQYGDEAQENQPNPLLRPARWSYETVRMTRTDAKDRQGNPYSTPVVAEPFESPPEFPYGASRWTVQRNLSWWNASVAESVAYAVNKDTWFGKPKWTVLCDGIRVEGPNFESDVKYWTWTGVFFVNTRQPWMPVEIASKGYRYKDWVGDEDLKPDDNPSSTLIWIDADGNGTDEPYYLERYPWDEADFQGAFFGLV